MSIEESFEENIKDKSGDKAILEQESSINDPWSKFVQDLNATGNKIARFEQGLKASTSGVLPTAEIIGVQGFSEDTRDGATDKVNTYNTKAGVKVTLGEDGKPESYNSKGFSFEHHNDGWYYHQDSGGKWVPIEEPSIASDGTVHTSEKGGLFHDGRPHSLDGEGQKTDAAAPGADGLPEPGGGYGSYHYGYEFSTSDEWNQADLSKEIQQNYNKYFSLTGDKPSIVQGEIINLKLPTALEALGLKAPVKVIAANENGFAFESLPGHFEGAGRTIVFRIVPKESDIPGRKTWGLEVAAGGPVSDISQIPGTNLGGKGVWQIFDNNLNNRLPDSPS